MTTTKTAEDSFTSVKIPNSLRKTLKVIAAQENRYIYQIMADMTLLYLEEKQSNDLKLQPEKHIS